MISYANLGGLGAREGMPVVHTWEPPPPEAPPTPVAISISISAFLWLFILVPLFLLRQNRCSEAWWIWLPVVIAALVGALIASQLTGEVWSVPQAIISFVVGLAAMWLLMPFLESRFRVATFFKALPVLAGFSLLAFVPTLLADTRGWLDLRPYLAAVLALGSLATVFALTFGGFSVRYRFQRSRFLFWLAVWTVLAWAVIALPFVIIGLLSSDIEWGVSLLAILYASAITLALLVPLVFLSFFHPFYRARFFGFLNLPQPGPSAGAAIPPVIPEVYQPEGTPTAMGTAK